MIELNITLFIQFFNFIITLIVLNFILVKPIRTIILERKNSIIAMTQKIEILTQKVQTMNTYYKNSITKAQEKGKQYYKNIEIEANKHKEHLLYTALNDARMTLKEKQISLENEADVVQQKIKNTTASFSTIIATKITM